MQLFKVMVKHDKKPRERKYTVWRFVVMAETPEQAIELARPEFNEMFGQILHVAAQPLSGPVVTWDNYLSGSDEAFKSLGSDDQLFAD